MRSLFIFLLFQLTISTQAQNCNTSLLFKQGVVLEYKSYWALDPFSKSNFTEITQLIFRVKEVKDSNNIKYSYITKTGINPVNNGLKYEKQYIIACDGNKIAIPWDFYAPGIVYFSNRYKGNKRAEQDTGVHSSITYEKDVLLNFPAGSNNTRFDITGDQVIAEIFTRAFSINFRGGTPDANPGPKTERKNNIEAKIIDLNKMESNSITTPAGTFNCIVPKVLMDPKKNYPELGYKLFYTPEAGVVKVEALYSNFKHIGEYVELVSIKQ